MNFYRRTKAQISNLGRSSRSRDWLLLDDSTALLSEETRNEIQEQSSPFRFLDLPPELRLLIYGHLLKFEKSEPCQPQILASCKTINNEAGSILYEENRVYITIKSQGITAHNISCGPYIPAQSSFGTGARVFDFDAIAWPSFLRRMKSLYISVPQRTWYRQCPHVLSVESPIPPSCRKASIGNVIYTLCINLRGRHHKLLSFHTNFGIRNPEDTKAAFYPVRFLGLSRALESTPKKSTYCVFFDQAVDQLATDLRARNHKTRMKFLRNFTVILKAVSYERHDPRLVRFAGRCLSIAAMFVARTAGSMDHDTGGHCYDSDKVFTNTFKHAVVELRILLELTDISMKDPSLREAVNQLLWLDIELRTTPTTGKGEDTAKNVLLWESKKRTKALLLCS